MKSPYFLSLVLGLSLGFTNMGFAQTTIKASPDNTEDVNQHLKFLYGSYQPYQKFLKDLQTALDQDNRAKVASMIHYPIQINIHNQRHKIRSTQEFLSYYDEIFDPMLTQTIKKQSYSNLFANTKGIMVGENGELWFTGFCQDKACKKVVVKVIAINK
ncbi:hypothetical protein [Acinetobacter sp.]|uniref:hypothetical protein n=1 Tax=Acinetobacter sp. TaxID=472 RepID=UPI0031D2BD53